MNAIESDFSRSENQYSCTITAIGKEVFLSVAINDQI